MYVLKNAWKNIVRNKGRNILTGIIILAIIATSSVALIINNTAGGIIENYKERFGSEVSITPNMDKIQPVTTQMEGGGTLSRMQMPEQPSPEQYMSFGDSDYLSKAVYSSSVGLHDNGDINPIDEDKGGGGRGLMIMRSSGDSTSSPSNGDFYAKLLGYNYTPDEFTKDGTRQLIDGNFPENDGECIVSRDLLENSGLEIGDTVTFSSKLTDAELPDPDSMEEQETVDIGYTLTIVGYYEDMTEEYANDYMQNAYENRRNEIITTVNTVISQMREGFTGITVSATYYLKNPQDLEAFASELYAKGLEDVWNVVTDEASYNTIVKPVEGLKSVTYVFLAVVLILGAIILILLSSIAIRERKYEIGVLRAMGMKKHKVAFGLLSEVITITLVCLVLGLGAGIAAAQPVSDMLLDNQLKQIEEQSSTAGLGGANMMMGRGMMTSSRIGGGPVSVGMQTTAEALKEMDVSMSIMTIGEMILVALILAVLASSMGIMHITKYEPIKILSDRM